MGEVYLAEDTRLGRRVAIKVLRSDSADGIKRLKHEAQLAASLDHPNICSIYEVGEDSGQHFIAMQYVEGDSLAAKLRHGPLGLRETLELALPIADALAEAHRHGIVHRDVKPHNIMIGPRHQVKMLDFGLAKAWSGGAAATSEGPTFTSLTQSGALTGTLAYMSPEQARAERLDSRSDIFSFGAVLHEMLAGRPLFARGNPAETLSAILTFEPSPVTREVAEAPEELERIVSKALRKDREQRYQDIRDMRIDLAALREDREFRARLERSREDGADARATLRDHRHSGSGPSVAGRSRRWLLPTGVLLAIAAGSAAVYVHRSNLAWADAQLARLDELAHAGDYAAAYDLAQRIRRYRSETEELKRLLPVVSDDLSVSTAPSGAEVRLERFEPQADRAARAAPFVVGRTPISHVAIPRGDYVLRVELAGHEPFERTISSSLARGEFGFLLSPAIQVAARLLESGKVPSRMIPVPAGPYTLVGYGQPTQAAAHLGDYFIDKYEVSNREYKQFIDAGGYRERGFWKQPFANDGKGLSWEQAMRRFVDRTGLPGPRNWSGGSPTDGKADHPVTGVSWYESAAYAAFRGKTLPSIYQWEKAARDGLYHVAESAMPWGLYEKSASRRANFESRGTVPVDQLEFGMSPFGGFNLAGNVSEWLSNETSTGFAAGGGSWGDPPYIFGDYGTFPGFFSSDRLGFRCALTAPGVTGDQGGAKISAAEQAPVYPRSSDAQFQAWLAHYRYDRTPLEAKVEESVETPDWKRERVSYVSAGERVSAYLYLPRSSRPPFQVIQFLPGSDAYRGRPVVEVAEGRLAPNIKAGRAIFIVTLRGYTGRARPAGYARPDRSSVAFRELAVRDATDLRRGLDYLETRSDIDRTRLAFMNVSIGWQGIVFSAVEPRYRSVILMADGLYPNQVGYVAEANPVNFAPHIKPPKLMLNGRWDEDFAFKTEAEPLFKLLREPKRLQLFDGGHVPPAEIAVPIVNGWLDETLGPVKRD